MKKIILSFLLLTFCSSVSASQYTDYFTDIYSKEYKKPVKIVSKDEQIEKYEQKIGDQFISSIVYGVGYMKVKGQKKIRITYICLLKNSCEIFWGHIIPY